MKERLFGALRSFSGMQLGFAILLVPLRVYEFVGAGRANSMPDMEHRSIFSKLKIWGSDGSAR